MPRVDPRGIPGVHADRCNAGAKLELLVRECVDSRGIARALRQAKPDADSFFGSLWLHDAVAQLRPESAAKPAKAAKAAVKAASYDDYEKVPLMWGLDQAYDTPMTLFCPSQVRAAMPAVEAIGLCTRAYSMQQHWPNNTTCDMGLYM
jgi:hypothetical protein